MLVAAQLCAGAGLAAGIAVGALLAEDMLGHDGLAGLPVALFTLGSAGAAAAVGAISQRRGRRSGLVVGFIAGAVGAAGVVAAAVLDSIPLLFAALLLYGAGASTNLQARYAGADLALPERRGTALSIIMVSTTLGAVAGPNLVAPMGDLARSLSAPELAGPFMLAALAYSLAAVVLFALLRPDPYLTALRLAAEEGEREAARTDRPPVATPAPSARAQRGVVAGATVMVLTQIAMIAIMTMTPIHLQDHGHGLGAVGFVIGAHIAFMFLPSPLTGKLADRIGRMPVACAAAVILAAAGLVGAVAPGDSLLLMTVSLALLGLGWNAGLIAGTALVVDAAPLEGRAAIQGRVDLLIALAGASGGAVSGVVVAGAGFAVLALAGAALSLIFLPVLVWSRRPAAAGSGA
ncbi:MAG: MFS transporter [Miltoncostaeaceae bacterium]